MAAASHKILRQVMQLGYGDADTAFRLQDRISTLQRNRLQQVIERVMDEFETPGELIRVSSLELDLGQIEEFDLDVLLPIALEQALRHELSQLMVRKQYDPFVEVETLSLSEGAIEDWLFYLQNGIKRWSGAAQGFSLAESLKSLTPQQKEQLRERLVMLLEQKSALERLLGAVNEADLTELFLLLLGEKQTAETEKWAENFFNGIFVQTEGSFISNLHNSGTFLSQNVRKIAQNSSKISQNYLKNVLFKVWAKHGFSASKASKVRNETLAIAQSELKITLNAPFKERGNANRIPQGVISVELLEYVLYYGCIPYGITTLGQSYSLDEIIAKLWKQKPQDVVTIIVNNIKYSFVRNRLVYQLSSAHLQLVVEAAFPALSKALEAYKEWIKMFPKEAQNLLESSPVLRFLYLEALKAISENELREITIAEYQDILLIGVVNHLKYSELKTLKSILETKQQNNNASPISERFLQVLNERKPNTGKDLGDESISETTVSDFEKGTQNKPLIPKSLLREALEQMPPESSPLEKVPKSKIGLQESKLQSIENQFNIKSEEAAEGIEVTELPKSELEALLYYLNYGIWPEIRLASSDGESSPIPVPAMVLVTLLTEKPQETLLAIFPLLAVPRIRERLAYQFDSQSFSRLIAAYVSIHEPLERIVGYYGQLLKVAAISEDTGKASLGDTLPHFEVALKSFLLAILYEETNIVDLQDFVSQFFRYYQQNISITTEKLIEAVKRLMPILTDSEPIQKTFEKYISSIEAALNQEDIQGVDVSYPPVTSNDTAEALMRELYGIDFEGINEEDGREQTQKSDGLQSDREQQFEANPSTTRGGKVGEELNESPVFERVSNPLDSNVDNPSGDNAQLPTIDDGSLSEKQVGTTVDTDSSPEETTVLSKEDKNSLQTTDNQYVLENFQDKSKEQKTAETKDAIPVEQLDNQFDTINQSSEIPSDGVDAATPMEQYVLPASATLPFLDSQSLINQEDTELLEELAPIKTLKQKIDGILQKQIPEKVRQAKVLRPQNPFERETPVGPLEEPVFIENAGLVLLWPFVGRCFTSLGYTEKGLFKSMEMANRAIHLLQYMATGEEQAPEHLLVLNKILCGIPLFEAIERDIVLTDNEKDEADTLLKATIANWEKMSKLSVAAFRDSFLKRNGRLTENEVSWTLRVDQASYDMLLDTLPWTIGMIKLKCMEKVLYVEWR